MSFFTENRAFEEKYICLLQGGMAVNMLNATGEKRGVLTVEESINVLLEKEYGDGWKKLIGMSKKEFFDTFQLKRIQDEDPAKYSKNLTGLLNTVESVIQAGLHGCTHIIWDRNHTLLHSLVSRHGDVREAGSGQLKKIDPKTGEKITVDFDSKRVISYISKIGKVDFKVDTIHIEDISNVLSKDPGPEGLTTIIECFISWIGDVRGSVFLTGFWGEKYSKNPDITNWDFFNGFLKARGTQYDGKLITNELERELERESLPKIVENLTGPGSVLAAVHSCGSRTGTTYYPLEDSEVNFVNEKIDFLGQDSTRW